MESGLPITAMCICAEMNKCPANYTPVWKSHDTNVDVDLWKDSLFGRKINRFFCFTKDYPIADTYYVVEDVKLFNEKDNLPSGFVLIEKCEDTGEKAFQKKVLGIKVAQRFFTRTAVSDIIAVKGKKTPIGYSYIGEINGCLICIKFAQIPVQANTATAQNPNGTPVVAPPRPPNPMDQGFVVLPHNDNSGRPSYPRQERLPLNHHPQPFQQSQQHYQSTTLQSQSQQSSGPLQGVPFRINPIYDTRNENSGSSTFLTDVDKLERHLTAMNENLEKYNYDFKLEKSLIASVGHSIETF